MSQNTIASKIVEALNDGEFISTRGLARWLKVERAVILTALDEIEAAGVKLMRIRGNEGGVQLVEAA